MAKNKFIFPISFTCLSLALTAYSSTTLQLANGEEGIPTESHSNWSYEGETSPEHWAELNPVNAACTIGKEQSPINIEKAQAKEKMKRENMEINYISSFFSLVNNGHTIQGNIRADDNSIVLNGKTYTLAQFHFHTPSEHQLNGKPFDMELHLVHKSEDGQLAVLGLLIKEGKSNVVLEHAWGALPEKETIEEVKVAEPIDLRAIFPENQHTYRYEGSLTTPPCSEGVQWVVFKQPIEMSKKQISAFRQISPDDHRPLQPLGNREIIKN